MRVFTVICVLMLAVGCAAGIADTTRGSVSAQSTQDVVDAWNLNCAGYGFELIPPGFLGSMVHEETMGDMYFGSDYSVDAKKLMSTIQDEVDSAGQSNPGIDDLLIDVLADPVWFR